MLFSVRTNYSGSKRNRE